MVTAPAMTNWIVTYNDHASAPGSAPTIQADIHAAYYATEGHLVEFKNSRHQVVFAIDAGIVLTIQRADAAEQEKASA